ncbi:MAG: hypothetical protein HQK49_11020 [Oligoflexia bacterium]|nr:hypothetical protein [Oligoflexia bacterium]
MKKYAKQLKEYNKIDFDPEDILAEMSRLKGHRRKPISVALEEDIVKNIKSMALKKGIPYQVLIRLLIVDGVRRLKAA